MKNPAKGSRVSSIGGGGGAILGRGHQICTAAIAAITNPITIMATDASTETITVAYGEGVPV
jgi:hypothetical protein